ncbi:hypothetical protein ABE65_001960 [Fictibacillus phosphorivorans]|uniref:Uncharacterized protein n=1 Tax=Fictibacillus phosphorivorans TaxID=1221500 RepID=A0A160II77_9BACL|nr:hypothetical protein [Fictibacillus phosphorivorans]ANC75668.1 hypothetical protein ABE65_001960 [Fictibacillus phosphorivorans]
MEPALLLNQLKDGTLEPKHAFPQLASKVKYLLLPESELRIKTDEGEGPVVFTDAEAVHAFQAHLNTKRTDALTVLKTTLRNKQQLLLINPNHESMVVLRKDDMKLLMREYAIRELKKRGGANILLTVEGQLRFIELPDGAKVLPVYLSEADGKQVYPEDHCLPLSWHDIVVNCKKYNAEAAFLQMGHEEQIGLNYSYLDQLEGKSWAHTATSWAMKLWFAGAFLGLFINYFIGNLNEWLIAFYLWFGIIIFIVGFFSARKRDKVKKK